MSPSWPVPAQAMRVPALFQHLVCPVAVTFACRQGGGGGGGGFPASRPATSAMQTSTMAPMAVVSPSVRHSPGPACLSAVANALPSGASQVVKSGVYPRASFAYSLARHSAFTPAATFFCASQRCARLGPAVTLPLQPPTIATTISHEIHRIVCIASLLVRPLNQSSPHDVPTSVTARTLPLGRVVPQPGPCAKGEKRAPSGPQRRREIGRASCRERETMWMVEVA